MSPAPLLQCLASRYIKQPRLRCLRHIQRELVLPRELALWLQAEEAVKAAAGGEGVGAVERGLLLGKVYAGWRDHNRDAIATYDALVKARTVMPMLGYTSPCAAAKVVYRADPAWSKVCAVLAPYSKAVLARALLNICHLHVTGLPGGLPAIPGQGPRAQAAGAEGRSYP